MKRFQTCSSSREESTWTVCAASFFNVSDGPVLVLVTEHVVGIPSEALLCLIKSWAEFACPSKVFMRIRHR